MTKEQVIDMAVKAAIKYLEEKKKKEHKSRHDRRLRNTRMLLKHYNILKAHCTDAVYSSGQVDAADILDGLDDNEIYIESIKKSTIRTGIILAHVDKMLTVYKSYCDNSDKPEDQRRYRVIIAYYIQCLKISDICEEEGIDRSTYYRDINESIETLSSLIFGIDWLSAMRKT